MEDALPQYIYTYYTILSINIFFKLWATTTTNSVSRHIQYITVNIHGDYCSCFIVEQVKSKTLKSNMRDRKMLEDISIFRIRVDVFKIIYERGSV